MGWGKTKRDNPSGLQSQGLLQSLTIFPDRATGGPKKRVFRTIHPP
jgi:hypothetical protein